MKKTFFLLVFIAIFYNTNAQTIRATIPLGFNGAQIGGDDIAGYHKFGFHGGVGALIFLNGIENTEIGFEMIFNQIGSKSSTIQIAESITIGNHLNRNISFNQISVPVFFNYLHRGGGFIGAGLGANYLFSEKWIENGFIDPYPDYNFKSLDVTIMGQIGIKLSDNFRATVRIANSILPIGATFNSDPQRPLKPRNTYFTVRLDTILQGLFKKGRR